MNLFADRMATLGTENAFQVGADIAKAEAEGMDVIRFNLGEPDFDTPEFICKVACEYECGSYNYFSVFRYHY